MKKYIYFFSTVFCALVGFLSSCDDAEDFDNQIYISTSKVSNILLKGTNDTEVMNIRTEMARIENQDVTVKFQVSQTLVDDFNYTYGENASLLSADNYEIPDNTSTIVAGTVKGNDVKVVFKNLSSLDREAVYVLPVTVSESTIACLNSSRTTFFVIKGAALINSVACLNKNYLKLQNPSASTMKDMSQVSIEMYLKVNKFGKLISTLMGVENFFLFRIGDAGVPDNQLQLASSSGNITDAAWQIPTNEWIHIAATFDSSDGAVNFYVNGVKKGSTKNSRYREVVNWNMSNFYVGKSYNDDRWLDADVCEVRVWNRVLSIEEIKAKDHFYTVDPRSEGLVAYWKFDEASGDVIKDHTGNGNTLSANTTLEWTSVSLPIK